MILRRQGLIVIGFIKNNDESFFLVNPAKCIDEIDEIEYNKAKILIKGVAACFLERVKP